MNKNFKILGSKRGIHDSFKPNFKTKFSKFQEGRNLNAKGGTYESLTKY